MRCYTCDKADLVHEVKDIEHVYRGETLVIPSVEGDHCPACGDVVLGDAEGDRVSNAMLEFNQKVNASIASEIARTRKKLKLTQAGANRLFGGGVNAFSRYERGKVLPPQSLVHLFRLLDRHPELLAEIKAPSHYETPHGDVLAYA
ncbi:type II toxin-antitoxin system MqsA family antitoxin [Desulfovibrio sp. OttesenSCG-928-G15]|nr:type II toxin-antitoxin system MqsA family antitoxin [Desulfovibrio sp. OttesenSCG-928-G15]